MDDRPTPASTTRRRRVLFVTIAAIVAVGAVVIAVDTRDAGVPRGDSSGERAAPTTAADRGSSDEGGGGARADGDAAGGDPAGRSPRDPQQPVPARAGELVNPASSGHMWSSEVPGVLTFRGNPTRSYTGRGPVPEKPGVRWFHPRDGGMCRSSSVGGVSKVWCGSGWTGQPAVFERDGRTWVVVGTYDGAVHFFDADTGEELLAPFQTGDIIKGSVTVDPDGYPLVYAGSRDNHYRVLAIDRPGAAVELWRLSADAVSPTLWNNDWDGASLVLDDLLLEGGENSQFHAVRLNRAYDGDGKVTVDPSLVWHTPSWDAQVQADLAGDKVRDMSIENSVAVSGNTAYFANGGGLVSGWDLSPLLEGGTPVQTFRFWVGDDTDASIVVDDEGFLYVSVEYERANARAAEVGQLVKLDPRRPEAPIVWSYADRATVPAGFWATPALVGDVLVNATNGGRLIGLDRMTGEELWAVQLKGPTWQSPVVVDGTLVYGDCNGVLRGYDLADPRAAPTERWSLALGGCIESTPVVWKGRIFVGTRAGRFFSVGDDGELSSPTAAQSGGGGE